MKTIFIRMLARLTRAQGLHIQALLFFALAITAVVFAVGSEPVLLAALMPGIAWAVLLLSALLGLGDVLEPDWADGTLDDMLLSQRPLPALMAAKMLAHWLATGLPASIAATLCVGIMVPNTASTLPALFVGYALGSLCFSAIGIMAAALVLGSRRAATLLAVIVMPLCVPPLIFGAGQAASTQMGASPQAALFLLAAFSCASVTLAPFAAAAITRMKVTTP